MIVKLVRGVLLTALLALSTTVGYADITLGGYTFDDDAFPDAAFYVSGGPPGLSFPTTGSINDDLLNAADSDATTYIFGTPVIFDLVFIDNRLVNGSGADLVVFELGANDGALVDIEVEGSLVGALPYLLTPTGDSAAGFSLNAVAIDLDDFGIAAEERIQIVRINNDSSLVPGGQTISSAIAAVGALNSAPPIVLVDLDIKPGSYPNSIAPDSRGVVPVAILGSATFDVSDVDVTTLAFGPNGAVADHDLTDSFTYNDHLRDVNLDGYMDIVSHYRTRDTGITCGDVSATLTGETLDGQPIQGSDSIRTVGCRETRWPAIWTKDQDKPDASRRDGPIDIERR